MSISQRHHRRILLFLFVLILCLALSAVAMAVHSKKDPHTGIEDYPFSVLILGDSEMAGAGWEGGYANCILEAYPNAQVLNLAQSGSLLGNGDIYKQWEFYLSEGIPMVDFILLDGGGNDLFYTRRKDLGDMGLTVNTAMDLVYESLRSLFERIHEVNPDARIIYTLIPPLAEWKDAEEGPPAYDIQERFWKNMNIVASEYDYVTVLDLFSLNPFYYPCVECYRENLADSIHLNEKGYRKTFEYIDSILVAGLAKKMDQ